MGDYYATADTDRVLTGIKNANVDFNLALGDYNYDASVSESAWCDYVKNIVGPVFPFELAAGNHDSDVGDGYIDNFAACLPDRLSSVTGSYGKEYYFDYQGLARFIITAPNLNLGGEYYDYSRGTAHYSWVSDAIDSARAAGIKWVIVVSHQPCLNIEDSVCWIGEDLTNLLIEKKVDLVLQAHSHNYQRSKQLALSDPDCPVIVSGVFNSSCVVPRTSTSAFLKGVGPIFVIAGTGGRNLSYIDPSDPELPYFTSWSAGNSNPTFGFVKLTVNENSLDSQFIPVGPTLSYSDSFSIATEISQPVNYINSGESWKYLDNGSDQGTAWKNPGFNDSSWKQGPAQLGYGEGDEATVINYGSTDHRYITSYYRHTFTVNDPALLKSLDIRMLRDDGAVVYINGFQVRISNMRPGGLDYLTLADRDIYGTEESAFNSKIIDPQGIVVAGQNIIAVELHQVSDKSNDASFDLELVGAY